MYQSKILETKNREFWQMVVVKYQFCEKEKKSPKSHRNKSLILSNYHGTNMNLVKVPQKMRETSSKDHEKTQIWWKDGEKKNPQNILRKMWSSSKDV